jgi:transcription-repair coupling factor (superfamily II helicase)
VGGIHGGATGLLLARAAQDAPALLVVAPDAKAADATALDVRAFSTRTVATFPAWPHDAEGNPPDAEVVNARVAVLDLLARGEPLVVVAPLAALAQPLPAPEALSAAVLVVRAGEERPPQSLLEHLALSGYVRVGAVESPGEFAARGGVVDVFPFGARRPARLDFFGDAIESVRALDPGTQRSDLDLGELRVLALAPERLRDPVERESLLLEFLPRDAVTALLDPPALSAKAAMLEGESDPRARTRWKRLDHALRAARRLEVAPLPLGGDGDLDVEVGALEEVRGLALRAERGAPRGAERPGHADPSAALVEAFDRLGARVQRVVVLRRALGEEERLKDLFARHAAPAPRVEFAPGSLSRSFVWGPSKTAYVAYDDLMDLAVRERRPRSTLPPSRPIQDFLELEVGEPVVHLHHGIGLFRGLATEEGKDGPAQFLKVEFAEGTTLFVPVARIDLVQRYVGTGRRPRLSKVGGTEWNVRKAKVADAVKELAVDLLGVQALRRARAGPPTSPHPEWQKEFDDAFPWDDTPDQSTATAAIRADLASPRPMDRLLCGDVGYGKTEVALRAAFQVAAAGRQVAVLVPTTVLAEQHLRTFSARLAPYPLVVRALSRFRTAREQREIVAGLAEGSIDVVVGTHRLLSKDVAFRHLGLVVVDEEQRFGVEHKERLKALRADVDVLTLTATPIPRTLHMALLGIRDISNLTTPPPGRRPIETKVARMDEALVRETLRRELDRGGQAFFVHNRVHDLPSVASTVIRLVPEARIAVVHGRMDKDLVEERMLGFVRGDVDVLVTTTIVESGLDIPNANTIVIHNADRFGLAELHQLRGRVGRETRAAHCLLVIPRDRAVAEDAAHRLRALEEYSELGAGFRIAMRDLELRGAGNLLGPQQSGHIAAVGYELYCRLLAEAVRRVKRDAPRPAALAALDVDLPAGVPESYVRDARETFRLFRRVAASGSVDALRALREEVADRFGPPPAATERLLLAQEVRVRAGAAGLSRVAAAEDGGLDLHVAEGGRGLERLLAKGIPLRRIDATRAYLPGGPAAAAGDVTERAERALRRLKELLEAP